MLFLEHLILPFVLITYTAGVVLYANYKYKKQ